MIRNEYSYWLEVEGTDSEKAVACAFVASKLYDILVRSDYTPSCGSFEVNPNVGTIEQVDESWLTDKMKELSANIPSAKLTFESHDEEDHANSLYQEFTNGKETIRRYARLVEADHKYDAVTVNAAIELLTQSGMTEAAKFLRVKMETN